MLKKDHVVGYSFVEDSVRWREESIVSHLVGKGGLLVRFVILATYAQSS
jgi:hypothetical protein